MSAYSNFTLLGITDGSTDPVAVDVSAKPYGYGIASGIPSLWQAWQTQDADGEAADRIAAALGVAPYVAVRPPAKAGGLAGCLLHAIQLHSALGVLGATGPGYFADAVTLPATDTLDVPHGLGVVPDQEFVIATSIEDGTNWAVTAIDDTNVSLKNWGGDPVELLIMCRMLHSIEALHWSDRMTFAVAGVATTSVAHGLGVPVPYVFAYPYAAGGLVEPIGSVLLVPSDDTSIGLSGNHATTACTWRGFATAPHSIQQ